MNKYALYYVYAAIGTLLFNLGQNVMWNIASQRAEKNLSENKKRNSKQRQHD